MVDPDNVAHYNSLIWIYAYRKFNYFHFWHFGKFQPLKRKSQLQQTTLINTFFYCFLEKIRLDVSCESSARKIRLDILCESSAGRGFT